MHMKTLGITDVWSSLVNASGYCVWSLWLLLSHCNSTFSLFKELTSKRNKIACQPAGKQRWEEPRNTNCVCVLWVRAFSLVQWRDGNEAPVKPFLMWMKGCSVLIRRHIFPKKGLNCAPKGGVRGSDAGTSAGDTVPEHSPTQDIPVLGGGTKAFLSLRSGLMF